MLYSEGQSNLGRYFNFNFEQQIKSDWITAWQQSNQIEYGYSYHWNIMQMCNYLASSVNYN